MSPQGPTGGASGAYGIDGADEPPEPGPRDHGHPPDLSALANPSDPGEDGLKAFPHSSRFAGDDGTTPEDLEAAFALTGAGRLEAVVEALREARLLIPVVAELDEMETPAHEGEVVGEKSAHAAMVTVATRDGRAAIPVFSSVAVLAAWRPDARPVPVESRKAALAAGTEADSLLVLDPGSEHTALIPSQAVAAIATGEPWSNPLRDPDVHAAVARAVEAIPAAVRAEVQPGTDAEIRIVLALRPGLDRVGVISASQQMSKSLSGSKVVTDRIDSLELRITTAKDAPPA